MFGSTALQEATPPAPAPSVFPLTGSLGLAPTDLHTAILRSPLVVSPQATVLEAAIQMGRAGLFCRLSEQGNRRQPAHDPTPSSCVVVDGDRQVVGILTERDLVRLGAQQQALDELRVEQVMANPVVTLRESDLTDLFTVVGLLQQHHIRHLPIVDDQTRLVGLLTHDSLRQVTRPIDLLRLQSVSEVMSRNVVCAAPDDTLLSIAQTMAHHRVSSVVVTLPQASSVGSPATPVGIVTERDVVQFQVLGLTLTAHRVDSVMSAPLFTVGPEDSLWAVQQMMGQHWIRRVVVTGEGGELLGIVTQSRLLQALNPLGSYSLAAVLEEKVARLEVEKGQLAAIVESSQEAIISIDLAGTITSWNLAAARVYGYAAEAILGQPVTVLIPPERRANAEHILQRLQAGDTVPPYETQCLHRDGHRIDVALSLSPLHNREGVMVGVSKIMRDISARRASEARYRNLIETTLEGVWILDTQGKTTFVNQRMADMLGYAPADMEGLALTDFMTADDRPQAQAYLTRRRQGIEEQRPFKFKGRDGRPLWAIVSASVLRDEAGQIAGCISLVTDITQLVATQEALRASELRLSSVLNSSLDGIMAFRSVRDDQGQIVDFEYILSNPTACQLVGRSLENLIGQRLLTVLPGQRQEGLFDDYVQVVETGQPSHREFYYHHDGLESWFEHVAVKLEDGFAVTFRDISNLKRSEQNLQRANQELQDRIADLNQRHVEQILLSELSDFLQVCLTVEEACAALGSLVAPLFPHSAGGLFLGQDQNQMTCVAQWGEPKVPISQFPSQTCWALRWGHAHLWNQAQPGLTCTHIQQSYPCAEAVPALGLCIPLIAQGDTLGILSLTTADPAVLPEAKQHLARTVAEQIALAIANLTLRATLHRQSIRDPLTGLFNRRYLEEALSQEMARALRYQRPISVIMLDIDHFKDFNDTHGHEAGDYVLKAVSLALQESVRRSDVVCRYGGEELTILLPDLALEPAKEKAERLRSIIENLCLLFKGKGLGPITASLGVASFPDHGTCGTALLHIADTALYRAKAAGRNRVVAAI